MLLEDSEHYLTVHTTRGDRFTLDPFDWAANGGGVTCRLENPARERFYPWSSIDFVETFRKEDL